MARAAHPALGVAAVLALSFVGAREASAQDPRPAEPQTRTVSVRVMVVQAGVQKQGRIDPECADLPRKFGPVEFNTMRVIHKRQLRLPYGQRGEVQLPSGGQVRLLPVNLINRRLHMHVEVPGRMNGQLRMRPRVPVGIGGQRHGDGHLIVFIEPEF